jgi:hypothetical protein
MTRRFAFDRKTAKLVNSGLETEEKEPEKKPAE